MDTEVVIVGGGPSGLTAALCLGSWGVRTIVVERRTSPPRHPQATMVNVRTTEIMRHLGILDEVEKQGTSLEDSARVSFVSSLAGEKIGVLEMVESDSKLMELAALSPTLPIICPQRELQKILLAALERTPAVTVLRGCEAKNIAYNGDQVEVQLDRGDGRHSIVSSCYLMLAEGLNGSLRSQVGIELIESPSLGELLDIHFTADLSALTRGRESALYWVVNQDVRGVLITVSPRQGDWLLEIPALHGSEHVLDLYRDTVEYRKLVTAAIGVDVDAAIQSVRTWPMKTTEVTRWRDAGGRIFVAGDAAHTFPPTGGFGMNTGIQDAHNLAWKLSGVIQGWASTEVLKSYETERRPVADFNATQSTQNALKMRDFLERQAADRVIDLAGPGQKADLARQDLKPAVELQRPHFDFYGQALGFTYQTASAPHLDVVKDVVKYVPTVEPGARAPHFWLRSDETRVTILDLCQSRFVLLVAHTGEVVWRAAVDRVMATTGVPIACFCVAGADAPPGHATLIDEEETMLRQYRLTGSCAVLVRPDGHVGALFDGIQPDDELRESITNLLEPTSPANTEVFTK